MKVGIVGAGIMGRLLAWQLAKAGEAVTLFDQDVIQLGAESGRAASYTAAGMITPLSEAESAEPAIVRMGLESLKLWPTIVNELHTPVDFHCKGSLILSHASDQAELAMFRGHISSNAFVSEQNLTGAPSCVFQDISTNEIATLEPQLGTRFGSGIYIPGEAWISPPLLLEALATQLKLLGGKLQPNTRIEAIKAGSVYANGKTQKFDQVIDCRGLGARNDLSGLRGVRGELIALNAPDVNLTHLVRFMHPRYKLYIVPRANNEYIVGATQIESSSMAPITVRSAMELLSAAYSVHPGFGEANIIATRVNCRPALPDNIPTIICDDGLLRINGLFRHGILLAPYLAQTVMNFLNHEKPQVAGDQTLSLNTRTTSNHQQNTHETNDTALH